MKNELSIKIWCDTIGLRTLMDKGEALVCDTTTDPAWLKANSQLRRVVGRSFFILKSSRTLCYTTKFITNNSNVLKELQK